MSLAITYTRGELNLNAPLVTVEVHLSNGLPSLSIVGLPEAAVKESKDRVRSAILNSQFEFPARRITINLAPADLPKAGGRYDLAIALGILAASQQIPTEPLSDYEFIGELALTGKLRAIRGTLPVAIQARNASRTLIVPEENQAEAALVGSAKSLSAPNLLAVCAHLKGCAELTNVNTAATNPNQAQDTNDLEDVHGQQHAKRALEIAAAGGHSLIMVGPPGTGKTMLASRLPSILPKMSEEEALEASAIASLSNSGINIDQWRTRPFRAPHHTASGVALVGGGSYPRPGEISLAHNGVMFLDELPEFDRKVLEVLREPIESGKVTISRAGRQSEFPACFQLIAAMNPCPCGHLGNENGRCQCTADQVHRYRGRISGPLLDRIDMHIEVPNINRSTLAKKDPHRENSATVRNRVELARSKQEKRCNKANFALNNKEIEAHCELNQKDNLLLETASKKLGLSARAYHRILKVARTIADLGNSEYITTPHLSEAISYRRLDRNTLG